MKLSSDLFYQFYKNQWIMARKHPGEEQLENDESVTEYHNRGHHGVIIKHRTTQFNM